MGTRAGRGPRTQPRSRREARTAAKAAGETQRPSPRFTLLDAPANLGLKPTGVERLADALRAAGLREALGADDAGRVSPPSFDPLRDPETRLRNGPAIREYAGRLADAVTPLVEAGQFPVVLGGDCSILLGAMLALRRKGRYGLMHVDGHADFYGPTEPNGEVASMDLALVSGRGPDVLTDFDGLRPLVQDADIVQFGSRDAEDAAREGSPDIRVVSDIAVYDLALVRALGLSAAVAESLPRLARRELAGFWIHLDADVLDDALMPAVDYRRSGGLRYAELRTLLRLLLASGQAVGMTVTIFNPALDMDGTIARDFTAALASGLTRRGPSTTP